MFASGAIAWTASTSRVSSPYQPDASQSFSLLKAFGSTWESCPEV